MSIVGLPWPFRLTVSDGLTVKYSGATNNSRLDRLHCVGNGRYGVYIRGADANQGSFIGVDCRTNGHGGIADLSFLGNKWYAAHVDSGPVIDGFPYATPPGNARVEFYGCDTEGPVGSWIYSPSIVFGGIMSIRRDSTGAQIYPQTLGLSIRPALQEINNWDLSDVVQFAAPDNNFVGRVAFGFSSNIEGDVWRFQHSGPSGTKAGWWALVYGNSDALVALSIAGPGNAAGIATVWFPQQRTYFGPGQNTHRPHGEGPGRGERNPHPGPQPVSAAMGATFSDRPSTTGPRYVFSAAVTRGPAAATAPPGAAAGPCSNRRCRASRPAGPAPRARPAGGPRPRGRNGRR
jgi:hypothetical protein